MTHPASGNATWQDYPNTTTPVTAASLEGIENALDEHETALASGGATKPIGHAGYTAGSQGLNNVNGAFLNLTASQITRGGVTFSAANDSLTVPTTGPYRVSAGIYMTGGTAPWKAVCAVTKNDSALPPTTNLISTIFGYKPDATDWTTFRSAVVELAAGDVLRLHVKGSSGSVYGTSGYETFLAVEYVGP
jgi:hypothetical protein